jgi:hexosaminidase
MRRKVVGVLLVFVFVAGAGMQHVRGQVVCPIIPLPSRSEMVQDIFILNDRTPVIVEDPVFQPSAWFLQKQILHYASIPVTQQSSGKGPVIVLAYRDKKIHLNKEKEENMPGQVTGSYSLSMSANSIRISAGDPEGMFYGVISLLQLIAQSPHSGASVLLHCWNIRDSARYAWRGLMLDESRHFFGKAALKKILDQMAFYKLNRFHWHLTDEPGWRLEIKRYPLLASAGGIGNNSDPQTPAQYYTQEDISEIVSYAGERHITVIPEIDMPGHATAANKAYPEYSGGGSPKHPEFTFNPGKEATYQYLADILKEVNVLFPAHMIHLGGDEVSYGNDRWKSDKDVLQLMKDKGLTDLTQVEQYFIERMADTITGLNNFVLGWDEITHARLKPGKSIVFWWRQDKPEQLNDALDKGFSVVLCPRLPFYFDFVQDSSHRIGRKWGLNYNSLAKVYGFSIKDLPAAAAHPHQVLGLQANLWTETVQTEQRMEYLIFPRLLALAEAAWTTDNEKDFMGFCKRLAPHLSLLQREGIFYYDPVNSSQTEEPQK